jgi:CBS domain-containing protein
MKTEVPKLLQIAHVPAPSVPPTATVREAVAVMVRRNTGAVVVEEGGRVVGIFTERDLMTKIVHPGRDPEVTRVSDAMFRQPHCLSVEAGRREALDRMIKGHFRHMPIVDGAGHALAVLSLRQILEERLEWLREQISSLESYMSADGPGG